MKKIIEVPLMVDMKQWHEITESISESEVKERLMRALERELREIDQEYVYFNPNEPKEIA